MTAGKPDDVLVVLVTVPPEKALDLAHQLVEERLAACANLLPRIHSVYRWEGKVTKSNETLLVLKTTRAREPALAARVRALHPYQCPEFVALPAATGLPDYLAWVRDSVADGG